MEVYCLCADEELAFNTSSRAQKESDGLNMQTTGSSYLLPSIWNNELSYSDGDELDLSLHSSPRESNLCDLDVFILHSELRFLLSQQGSKDVFDEGDVYNSVEEDSSDCENDRAQDVGVIIQFDAN